MRATAAASRRFALGSGRFVERRPGGLHHPERETHAALAHIKKALGSYYFSAQYLQAPVPVGGAMIRWKWLGAFRERPPPGGNDRIVQSWDTASKAAEMNDYSVRATWREHGNGNYLTDVVSIENKGSGTHLIQDSRRDGVVRPIAIPPEGDKVTRMAAPWRARGLDGPAEARPWRCSNEGRRRRLPLPRLPATIRWPVATRHTENTA